VDLNGMNRMPITAMYITSEHEKARLKSRQAIFMTLDILIIVNVIIFFIVGPIEHDKSD
jgi:hypothetical protein